MEECSVLYNTCSFYGFPIILTIIGSTNVVNKSEIYLFPYFDSIDINSALYRVCRIDYSLSKASVLFADHMLCLF